MGSVLFALRSQVKRGRNAGYEGPRGGGYLGKDRCRLMLPGSLRTVVVVAAPRIGCYPGLMHQPPEVTEPHCAPNTALWKICCAKSRHDASSTGRFG